MFGENETQDGVTPDATSSEVGHTDDTSSAASSGQDTAPQQEATGLTMEDVVAQALASDAAQNDTAKDDEGDDPDTSGDDASATTDSAKGADADGDTSKKSDVNGDDDDLPDDPTDEELAGFRRPVQKRVKKLLAQRNEARRALAELEPDAHNFRELRSFMSQNNLVDEDTRQLLAFGAHLRSGRYDEAFALAAPFMQVIMEGSGRAIPADLRERVENGEITDEMARQVAKERHARIIATERAERTEQQVQQQVSVELANRIRKTTADWEAQTRRTDPDFDLKAQAMRRFAVALVAEKGPPLSEEKALEYAQKAYLDATEFLNAARPKPKPTRTPLASGHTSNRAGSQPAALSLEDAIKAGLEMGARG